MVQFRNILLNLKRFSKMVKGFVIILISVMGKGTDYQSN